MLNSTSPFAAAVTTATEPIYSAPARNLSELKKGIRRYDEPALTKEKLSSMKAAKAKPALTKAAMQPRKSTASPYTTTAATAGVNAAVVGSSSRLPIPVRTSSIAPGAYAHPPTFKGNNDTWCQTTWSAEPGGPTTTIGESGFQPIQKKKRNKRKTGKAATEWVVAPDDAFDSFSKDQARVPPPGATYVNKKDSERFAAKGSRRNKAGGRSSSSFGSGGGGTGGGVHKDSGEDGKGSIYDL